MLLYSCEGAGSGVDTQLDTKLVLESKWPASLYRIRIAIILLGDWIYCLADRRVGIGGLGALPLPLCRERWACYVAIIVGTSLVP